eukprot:PhM_4_TR17551/c1_g1_i1/m.72348
MIISVLLPSTTMSYSASLLYQAFIFRVVLLLCLCVVFCDFTTTHSLTIDTVETFCGNGVNTSVDSGAVVCTDAISLGGQPGAMAFNPVSRHLFIPLNQLHAIRRLSVDTDVITTFAGTVGSSGSANHATTPTLASFNSPSHVDWAFSDNGNLYVSDTLNHLVRKIVMATGAVSTVAGSAGLSGYGGDNGLATPFAMLSHPVASLHVRSWLFISDAGNSVVRRVWLTSNIITSLTGTTTRIDGITQYKGMLYASAKLDNAIYTISVPSGSMTLLVGGNTAGYADTPPWGSVQFHGPNAALIMDCNTRSLFVAETANAIVRRVDFSHNNVERFVGVAGAPFATPASGARLSTPLDYPSGLSFVGSMLYIAEHDQHRLKRVQLSWTPSPTANSDGCVFTQTHSTSFTFTQSQTPSATPSHTFSLSASRTPSISQTDSNTRGPTRTHSFSQSQSRETATPSVGGLTRTVSISLTRTIETNSHSVGLVSQTATTTVSESHQTLSLSHEKSMTHQTRSKSELSTFSATQTLTRVATGSHATTSISSSKSDEHGSSSVSVTSVQTETGTSTFSKTEPTPSSSLTAPSTRTSTFSHSQTYSTSKSLTASSTLSLSISSSMIESGSTTVTRTQEQSTTASRSITPSLSAPSESLSVSLEIVTDISFTGSAMHAGVLTISADDTTTPAFAIFSLQALGLQVRQYDSQTPRHFVLTCNSSSSSTTAPPLKWTNVVTMNEGVLKVPPLPVVRHVAGLFPCLAFHKTHEKVWLSKTFNIHVVPGAPASFRFVQNLLPWADPRVPLPVQPMLRATDAHSNDVDLTRRKTPVINVNVAVIILSYSSAQHLVAVSENITTLDVATGFASFRRLRIIPEIESLGDNSELLLLFRLRFWVDTHWEKVGPPIRLLTECISMNYNGIQLAVSPSSQPLQRIANITLHGPSVLLLYSMRNAYTCHILDDQSIGEISVRFRLENGCRATCSVVNQAQRPAPLQSRLELRLYGVSIVKTPTKIALFGPIVSAVKVVSPSSREIVVSVYPSKNTTTRWTTLPEIIVHVVDSKGSRVAASSSSMIVKLTPPRDIALFATESVSFVRTLNANGIATFSGMILRNALPGKYVFTVNATSVPHSDAFVVHVKSCVVFSAEVHRVIGCPARLGCPSDGRLPLTIIGAYFSAASRVYINDIQCGHTQIISAVTLVALRCKNTNVVSASVEVRDRSTTSIARWHKNITYRATPKISYVTGCRSDAYPSTGFCEHQGTNVLRLHGSNFVKADVTSVVLKSAEIHSVCKILHRRDDFMNITNCPGYGSQLNIALTTRVGDVHIPRGVTVSFAPTLASQCGISSVNGKRCGFGTCDVVTGICICGDTWRGETCDQCRAGRYGKDCRPCPGFAAGAGCSGHGVCSEGRLGTGKCTCEFGYARYDCGVVCQGGAETPCSGHGVCHPSNNGTCTCYESAARGYWTGTQCNRCVSPYSGSECLSPCPVANALTCAGNGECVNGVCFCDADHCGDTCLDTGVLCSSCQGGYFGPGCTQQCPGGGTCSGHGRCDEGERGTGLCRCDSGWSLSDCSTACPGGSSHACSGHGTCDTTTAKCMCQDYWSTPDCSVACPGFPHLTCAGHGTCTFSAASPATCSCFVGWSGADCGIECPGGSRNPCSGHGTCDTTTSKCTCFADISRGVWAGDQCDGCAADWFSENCNQQCGRVNDLVCAGHGVCTPDLTCRCEATWTGKLCDECVVGYWGELCDQECPGGACLPCSGHGTCHDGRLGTGQCQCMDSATNGTWAGNECYDCAPGYWGETCLGTCPRSEKGVLCHGHGTCSDGIAGSGNCTCFETDAGYWGTISSEFVSCDNCAYGWYGPYCQLPCPVGAQGVVCNGHGRCDSGIAGRGTCACEFGWVGDSCVESCPVGRNGAICGGGTCVNSASCSCFVNFYLDPVTRACEDCITGIYGENCTLLCPRSSYPEGAICFGHGKCHDGVAGNGTCACDKGWTGSVCDVECLGGAATPCNNHGECNPRYGVCTCHRDPALGFWQGDDCGRCDPFYEGNTCTKKCPTNSSGGVCNGRGSCYEGKCFDCVSGFCGTACESSGVSCGSSCLLGRWGDVCQFFCPGIVEDGAPCNGHGVCSSGRAGTGVCMCFEGYSGDACERSCPGATSTGFCSGHGRCSNAKCTCESGYTLEDCSMACPGGVRTPCNLRGVCKSGVCQCEIGWQGMSCDIPCPGGSFPCYGHGTCNALGRCECYNDDRGRYSGQDCTTCLAGYHGADCSDKCVGGETDDHGCHCYKGWAGASCQIPCPGVREGNICSGHGICRDGNTNFGTCACDENYFTANCSMFCTPERCLQVEVKRHAVCHPSSGACVCRNDVQHWAGRFCDECRSGWWGQACSLTCPCNDHGTCDQNTGVCSCFRGNATGFWGGANCDKCADGYVGVRCLNRDISLTFDADTSISLPVEFADRTTGVVLDDAVYNTQYSGSRPLYVLTATAQESHDFSGTATSAWVSGQSVYVAFTRLDSAERSSDALVVQFSRESGRPTGVTSTFSSIAGTSSQQQRLSQRRLLQNSPNTPFSTFSTIVATIGFNNSEIIVYSAGVLVSMRGPDVVSSIDISSTTTSITLEGACVLDESTALLFGTSSSNRASMLILGRDGTISPSLLLSELGGSAICTSSTPCRSFNRCKASQKHGITLCLLTLDDGIAACTVQISVTQLTASMICSLIQSNLKHVTFDGPLMMHDTALLAIFGFHAVDAATTVMKLSLETLQPTGLYTFSVLGNDKPIVKDAVLVPALNEVHVFTPLQFRLEVVRLLIHGVGQIQPTMADTVGGTTITVTGEGFLALTDPVCRLASNSKSVVSATVDSDKQLRCVMPSGGESGQNCAGVKFDVGTRTGRISNNRVYLRRPDSAKISRVTTPHNVSFMSIAESEIVTVMGFGFLDSSYLLCRVKAQRGYYRDNPVIVSDVTFISSTEVRCRIPVGPSVTPVATSGAASLEVSLDGTVFSASQVPFAFVAPANNVHLLVLDPSSVTLKATSALHLPSLLCTIVDNETHPVGWTDGATQRHVSLLAEYDGKASSILTGITSQLTLNGTAQFDYVFLLSPAAGVYRIVVSAAPFHPTWSHSVNLTVVPGDPAALYLLDPQERIIENDGLPLKPLMSLILIDGAGNKITEPQRGAPQLRARYLTAVVNGSAYSDVDVSLASPPTSRGRYEFPTLTITALHTHAYSIAFDIKLIGVIPFVFRNIRIKNCEDGMYGHPDTPKCRMCPESAICDGTANIEVMDNFWRAAPDAYTLYSCAAPHSANSCLNGTCLAGYVGPRCSTCDDGYGRMSNRCTQCGKRSVDFVVLFFLALGVFLVIMFLVATNLSAGRKDPAPILLKMMLNHLQVVGQLEKSSIKIPAVVRELFTVTQQISSASGVTTVGAVDCALRLNFTDRFYLSMTLPWLFLGVIFVLCCFIGTKEIAGHYEKKRRKVQDEIDHQAQQQRFMTLLGPAFAEQKDHERRMTLHRTDPPERKLEPRYYAVLRSLTVRVFVLSAVTIFFLMYPDLLKSATQMLRCENLDFGEKKGTKQVLMAHRTIFCGEPEQDHLAYAGTVFAFSYGAGVPIMTALLVLLFTFVSTWEIAFSMFSFMTSGYRTRTWYWECVIMIRKAAVVCITVFSTHAKLQIYMCMWTMGLFLAVSRAAQPFEARFLNILELVSLSGITLTLNLLLLFEFLSDDELAADYLVLTIILVVINAVVIGVIGVAFLVYARRKLSRLARNGIAHIHAIVLMILTTNNNNNNNKTNKANSKNNNNHRASISSSIVEDGALNPQSQPQPQPQRRRRPTNAFVIFLREMEHELGYDDGGHDDDDDVNDVNDPSREKKRWS